MRQKRTPKQIAAEKRETREMLSWSLDRFYKAYTERAKTGERRAYIIAIEEVGRALDCALVLLDDKRPNRDIRDWFDDLAQQLEDLNSGTVSATLDCMRSKGLGTAEWMRRVGAVLAVELMHCAGMKYRAAATRASANRPELSDVSEKKLLGWCAEFRKGRVKNKRAGIVYRNFMNQFSSLDKREAKKWAEFMFGPNHEWWHRPWWLP